MSETRIVPFTMDHYKALVGPEATMDRLNAGMLSVVAGPAWALVEGKQVLAAGGVRTLGIGQAWALLAPAAAQERLRSIVRAAHTVLDQTIAHERLVRVYAEASVDAPHWFEHLGFVLAPEGKLYVR
ncbi:MAG: hypothetical protein V2B18_25360 [Pseudomonadota bacterium]